jgi:hypothetical protein
MSPTGKKCGACRQQFTVKVGTVFGHGRIPLHRTLQAVYLMTSSKKGIPAHQFHRVTLDDRRPHPGRAPFRRTFRRPAQGEREHPDSTFRNF